MTPSTLRRAGDHLSLSPLCVTEQREFEGSLKKRKRDFGETLERYEAEIDKYAQRSELSKRDEVAAQVTELSQKLKEVRLLALGACSQLHPVNAATVLGTQTALHTEASFYALSRRCNTILFSRSTEKLEVYPGDLEDRVQLTSSVSCCCCVCCWLCIVLLEAS